MAQDRDRTTLFILADQLLGGELPTKLQRWRQAGVSLRSIQRLLEHDLGVRIALETIRRWVAAVEADTEAA